MPYVPVQMSLNKVPKLPNGKHQLSGNVAIYIVDGQKHRHPGPAEEHKDGYKAWFWRGLRHRDKGPAVVYPDGSEEYWTHGKLIRKVSAAKAPVGPRKSKIIKPPVPPKKTHKKV